MAPPFYLIFPFLFFYVMSYLSCRWLDTERSKSSSSSLSSSVSAQLFFDLLLVIKLFCSSQLSSGTGSRQSFRFLRMYSSSPDRPECLHRWKHRAGAAESKFSFRKEVKQSIDVISLETDAAARFEIIIIIESAGRLSLRSTFLS